MNDRISTLRLFCRVARTESFTTAGKETGLSQPSVSRIISQLEKNLGIALFMRSTHAVRLTEAGADYLARIDPILSALDEANHLARGDGKLQGHLRVGTATSFAVREIIPRLPGFLEEHPGLHVDLVLTDSHQDLIDQAIDVALRVGPPLRDSTLVARKLAESPRLLAASPDYLSKAGTPATPADLAQHRIILGPSSAGPAGWNFKKSGKELSIRVEGQLMVTVNEASTAAALANLGIISTALVGCRSEIEDGRLVQILTDWKLAVSKSMPYWLVQKCQTLRTSLYGLSNQNLSKQHVAS